MELQGNRILAIYPHWEKELGFVSGAAPHSQTPNPAIVGMRLPEQGICNRPGWNCSKTH
jgi:hypothetical protein